MRTNRLTAATLAALLGVLAGCGGANVGADDRARCPEVGGFQPQVLVEVLDCDLAIALADQRLGWLHWPVSTVQVRLSLCPPNARCVAGLSNQAWVVYEFWFGDPVMVHVQPRIEGDMVTDDYFAGEVEAPPDWLLEELARPEPFTGDVEEVSSAPRLGGAAVGMRATA
jgi:hypothetical protein